MCIIYVNLKAVAITSIVSKDLRIKHTVIIGLWNLIGAGNADTGIDG